LFARLLSRLYPAYTSVPDSVETYDEYQRYAYNDVLPVGIIVGVVGVATYLLLDQVVYPQFASEIAGLRFLSIGVTLLGLPMVKIQYFRDRPAISLYTVMLGLSIPVAMMTFVTDGFNSWYMLGMILILNSGLSIVPYFPIHHVVVGIITAAVWVAGNLAIHPETVKFATVFEKAWWLGWFVPTALVGLVANIHLRRALWDERIRWVNENRELLHRTLNAEEVERQNLAQELHDMIGQDVVAMRQQCALTKRALGQNHDQADLEGALSAVAINAKLVEGVDRKIRLILKRLVPETIKELGLVGAIKEQLSELQKSYPDTRITGSYTTEPVILSDDDAIAIYRTAIEAAVNCLRHADAGTVWVAVKQGNGTLHIQVDDDGKGFDTEKLTTAGFGIRGMRERVRSLKGKIEIESAPGAGTKVLIEIPTRASDESSTGTITTIVSR